MRENTIDNWVKLLSDDLDTVAYQWAEHLGNALTGAGTGELDVVIEQLKANTLFDETTAENAAEQIARVMKWRLKLLKVGMATTELVGRVMAIAQALDGLALNIAEDKYPEYIELDYLPSNPESMAGDGFRPRDRDDEDRDRGGWGRQPED